MAACRLRRRSLDEAVVAACLGVSDKTLRECQERQQRLVGIPALNRPLYDYFESHRGPALIATDYQAMAWLPELGPWSVRCACEDFERLPCYVRSAGSPFCPRPATGGGDGRSRVSRRPGRPVGV